MALSVFFAADIRDAILAAEQSSSATFSATTTATASPGAYSDGFREGYRAALITLALAFGLLSQWSAEQSDTALCELKRGELR